MFKNYFKTTIRNLWRNKTYSFLNIFGLAVGVACAMLIFLWVEDEVNFDHNYEKKNYLYKVFQNQSFEEGVSTMRATSGPLANALKTEIPGIKNTARLSFNANFKQLFSFKDKMINEQGYYADSSAFSMLMLPFVYGRADNAFKQVHSLVISESMSKKLFSNTNPTGKTLKVNNEQEYIITGVFKDLPESSTLQFQWLASFEVFEATRDWLKGWNNNGVQTLVELQKGADAASVNEKLYSFLPSKDKQLQNVHCFLFSLNDWHLYNEFKDGKQVGGQIKYVRLFALIACIILIIACINFMNLSTASSEKRAKEVGVRKVMGANKIKLIKQFIGESILVSFLSVAIAVGIIIIALHSFNSLVEKNLSIDLLNPLHIAFLIITGLITGLLAGSYPAFYLSSFNPIKVLKGIKVKTNISAGFIRKGLVVTQFSVSIILIICTIIIYQQVLHIKNRDLGYNRDKLIYINGEGELKDHFDAVRNDLLSTDAVQSVALSADPLLQVGSSSDAFEWQGKNQAEHINIYMEQVSPHYVSTSGMKLITGRDFYSNPKADSNNIIINESLAKLMGKQGTPGNVIINNEKRYQVIGIVKDFVFNDVYNYSEPVILFCSPTNTNIVTIRFKDNINLTEALSKTASVIKTYNPAYPFEYRFVNEDFHQLLKTETLIGKLAGIFSLLAITISSLGLFGLAAYTAERRTKEISIRKVLGASVKGIAGLLSKDFLQLVFVSCIVAFPLGWLAMDKWLQNYAYRIEISWWIFLVSGVSAIIVALITVSFQAIKVAITNPVKSLRTE